MRRKTKGPMRTICGADQVPREVSSSRPEHPEGRGNGHVRCCLLAVGPPSAGETAQALAIIDARPDKQNEEPLAGDVTQIQQSLPVWLCKNSLTRARGRDLVQASSQPGHCSKDQQENQRVVPRCDQASRRWCRREQ